VALRRALLVRLMTCLPWCGSSSTRHIPLRLDRRLRRHGVGNLRDPAGQDCPAKQAPSMAYEPGYIIIDVNNLPQMS